MTTTLTESAARKKSIVENSPAIFPITENSVALGKQPFYELEIANELHKWCGMITVIAVRHRLDPDLLKAVIYMETTHGWYDRFYPLRKTILPMNIHYKYWRDMGVTKELLNCPHYNIEFGAILLSRISQRIEKPSVRKVATIYNFLGAEKVSEYGARVDELVRLKPWTRQGCR